MIGNEFERLRRQILIMNIGGDYPQDGYWVHKTTGVKTYFGANASFIVNGEMDTPSWILDASEVKVCSGVTSFKTTEITENGMRHDVSYTFNPNTALMFDPNFSGNPADLFNQSLISADLSLFAGNEIPAWLFRMCLILEKVILPENSVEIELQAFFTSPSLYDINLSNVRNIGAQALMQSALSGVVLDILVSVGAYGLALTPLPSIDLPDTVENIGDYAFGATQITTAICRATTPPTAGASIFLQCPISVIKVPAASVSAYKVADGWSEYADIITSI